MCEGAAAATHLVATNANNRTFAITGQHFNLNVISISDGIYILIKNRPDRPIEVPFKNYLSFTQSASSMNYNVPFNVASQSIDRLWVVVRPGKFNSNDARQDWWRLLMAD